MTNRLPELTTEEKLKIKLDKFNEDLAEVLTKFCYETTEDQTEIMINLRAMINCLHAILLNIGFVATEPQLDAWRKRLYANTPFTKILAEVNSLINKD